MFSVVCLNIAVSGSTYAAEFQPYINLAEYYTNNLFLVSDELKVSDWVTEVRPGITINYDSLKIIFDLDYSYQALFYADNDEFNGGYNQLTSTAWVDLYRDELRFFASANMTQVNVRPEGQLPNTNIPVTGNRTDASTLYGGPQWKRDLFLGSELDAFYYTGVVVFDSPDTQDITPTNARVAIQRSQDTVTRMRYEAAWEYVRLDYEDIQPDVVDQTLYLRLNYIVNQSFALSGLVGLESNLADPLDNTLNEGRWEVGFDSGGNAYSWSAGVGHRYFGTTYRLSFQRDVPDRVSYNVSYREGPANSDLIRLHKLPTQPTDPDVPLPPPDPDSGLDRLGAPTRFISKRLNASVGLTGATNAVTFAAYHDDQVSQTPTVPDRRSWGLSLNFNRTLGQRTEFASILSWQRRQVFSDDSASTFLGEDDTYRIEAIVNRNFSEVMSLSFSGIFDSRQDAANPSRDYDSVLLALRFTRSF